jgi:hypothetical protein
VVDFINLKMSRLGPSKVLIGIGCVCSLTSRLGHIDVTTSSSKWESVISVGSIHIIPFSIREVCLAFASSKKIQI